MSDGSMVRKVTAVVALVLLAAGNTPPTAADEASLGHVRFEVVGQVNNSPAPAPLGSSMQFGYLSFAEGVDSVFTTEDPANQNEATALLTFVTAVNTTRVTANGPLSVIVREGTTTIYRNLAPADFGTPATFGSGDPVVIASIRQQVIVDTVEKTFTATNINVVTGADRFDVGGRSIRLAHPGDVLRTSLVGVLKARDGVPPPTGFFSGYTVGAAPEDSLKR